MIKKTTILVEMSYAYKSHPSLVHLGAVPIWGLYPFGGCSVNRGWMCAIFFGRGQIDNILRANNIDGRVNEEIKTHCLGDVSCRYYWLLP